MPRTLAQALYADAVDGDVHRLPRAGTGLEHPLVYDSSAREIKALATSGLVEIVEEHVVDTEHGPLIDDLSFRRSR
jgi:hypothetical protein